MSIDNTRQAAEPADLSRDAKSAPETLTPEQEAKVKGGIGGTNPGSDYKDKLAVN